MALEPITRQEKIIAGQDLTPITRMEKFLKNFGGSGGGGGAQPDLSQTDTTKPDYVKGVIRQESLPEGYPWKEQTGVTVEWDGVGEGFESVVVSGHTYYRISELTLTHEELLASNITLSTSESIITYTGQEWKDLGMPFVDGGEFSGVVINDSELAVARGTTMFPKTGIYANRKGNSYIVGISWGVTVIHPIAAEFLPTATTSAAGTVKQAAAVADGSNINTLLASLRAAGILATE